MVKLKILISAYSCEPFLGSESEVGFNWAHNLHQKGHEIHVLTRKSNAILIEKFYENKSFKPKFIYTDLPSCILKIIKKKNNKYSYLYFYIWQLLIFFKFIFRLRNEKYDLVHHVTFSSLRYPPLICFLSKKFIYGPVGGGEKIPNKILYELNPKIIIMEKFRLLSNLLIKYSFINYFIFKRSYKIYVTTEETLKLIPKIFHYKTKILTAISIENKKNQNTKVKFLDDPLKLLFVGSAIYRKGINIIFKTIEIFEKEKFNFKLTLICNNQISSDARKYLTKINKKNIRIINYLQKKEIDKFYQNNHFLFFPSLRDSAGFVILEALKNRTPIITININGPKQLINEKIGILIDPSNKTINDISYEIYLNLKNISTSKNIYNNFQKNISNINQIYSWNNLYKEIYGEFL